MKLTHLFEAVVTLNADELRKEAEAAGHKLYDNDTSGLIFDGNIKVMTLKQYIGDSDAGAVYDTFDYIFRPPRDVADTRIKNSDAVDGVIYVAGANGIALITMPGTKVKITGDLDVVEKDQGSGAYWKVWDDKKKYHYIIGPRRGQPPLPEDPKEVIKAIRDMNGKYRLGLWHIKNPMVEKPSEQEIADYNKFHKIK